MRSSTAAILLLAAACLGAENPTLAFVGSPASRKDARATTTRCHLASNNANGEEPALSRREALQQWGGIALSSFLLQNVPPAEAKAFTPKNILITGSNSGIGYQAAVRLAGQGHNLILACRTMDKSADAIQRINNQLQTTTTTTPGKLVAAECDLASLESIKSFAKTLEGQEKLDVVCLNAGLARNTAAKDVLRTKEGFELTVGTNHFGHFYLNHLLLPRIEPSGGKIVVTASTVHNPESPGGSQGVPATLGDLKGLEQGPYFDMVDGGEFNADKAYKDSKLCNVLFTRELQRRLASSSATSAITANCFNPGLIITSGFFRDQSPLFTKVFDSIATNIAHVTETPEWGGGALAYMTTVDSKGKFWEAPSGSSKYGDAAFGKQFTESVISKEAQDDAKATKLWELSEKLVGISA